MIRTDVPCWGHGGEEWGPKQAAIAELTAVRPLGAAAVPSSPHPLEPILQTIHLSSGLCCVGVHPAGWAASEHTELCHPRNVFDQVYTEGKQSRASNPFPQSQRWPPALSHTRAQHTIARGRGAGGSRLGP